MAVVRVAVPPVSEKRNALPWLFFIFFCLVFFWLVQSDVGFALGVLVSASAVVAALETAYAGMFWCTAAFAALAMMFNPFVHFLSPLDPSIAALAMVALSPMLLLFVCRRPARMYAHCEMVRGGGRLQPGPSWSLSNEIDSQR